MAWLAEARLETIGAKRIEPSRRGNWLYQVENEWDDLLPVADTKTKAAKVKGQERAVFKQFGNGINTARDSWVVSWNKIEGYKKAEDFLSIYSSLPLHDHDERIKWSRNLKDKAASKQREKPSRSKMRRYAYRPFSERILYHSNLLIDEQGFSIQQDGNDNIHLAFPNGGDFRIFASSNLVDFHFIGDSRVVSRYRYTPTGERVDNLTDWALNQFVAHYGAPKRNGITKDTIFAYVYACLHDPTWRETYAINLRREFPRLPFHRNFAWWAGRGRDLLDLHVGYE